MFQGRVVDGCRKRSESARAMSLPFFLCRLLSKLGDRPFHFPSSLSVAEDIVETYQTLAETTGSRPRHRGDHASPSRATRPDHVGGDGKLGGEEKREGVRSNLARGCLRIGGSGSFQGRRNRKGRRQRKASARVEVMELSVLSGVL